MLLITRLILFVAIVMVGVAFHIRNKFPVKLDYYAGEIELPVSLIIVLMLLLGALLGGLVSLPTIIKLKRQKLQLKKQIKHSEEEINNLRVMPVRD